MRVWIRFLFATCVSSITASVATICLMPSQRNVATYNSLPSESAEATARTADINEPERLDTEDIQNLAAEVVGLESKHNALSHESQSTDAQVPPPNQARLVMDDASRLGSQYMTEFLHWQDATANQQAEMVARLSDLYDAQSVLGSLSRMRMAESALRTEDFGEVLRLTAELDRAARERPSLFSEATLAQMHLLSARALVNLQDYTQAQSELEWLLTHVDPTGETGELRRYAIHVLTRIHRIAAR